jgi:transposase
MRLSDHDLRQIDEAYLEGLSAEALREVSKRLCQDLKEARERLNQTPENSSRPPSTRAPWTEAPSETEADEHEEEQAAEGAKPTPHVDSEAESTKKPKVKAKAKPSDSPRKPGRQSGTPGYGRTQHLPVTGEVVHRAEQCSACGQELDEHAPFVACTGHYVLDIEWGDEAAPGTLNQSVHEAAHAVLPVEEQLIDEVNPSALLHGDETSWKEAGKRLWLWVFTSTAVPFYLIGYRTREFLDNLLGEAFRCRA